jgi:hypothetical protein
MTVELPKKERKETEPKRKREGGKR